MWPKVAYCSLAVRSCPARLRVRRSKRDHDELRSQSPSAWAILVQSSANLIRERDRDQTLRKVRPRFGRRGHQKPPPEPPAGRDKQLSVLIHREALVVNVPMRAAPCQCAVVLQPRIAAAGAEMEVALLQAENICQQLAHAVRQLGRRSTRRDRLRGGMQSGEVGRLLTGTSMLPTPPHGDLGDPDADNEQQQSRLDVCPRGN